METTRNLNATEQEPAGQCGKEECWAKVRGIDGMSEDIAVLISKFSEEVKAGGEKAERMMAAARAYAYGVKLDGVSFCPAEYESKVFGKAEEAGDVGPITEESKAAK
jgi:hypothetical protein